jgi:hypothetical protein
MDDERKAAIMARSAAIAERLARELTPEELAENEARRKRNLIDRIMRGEPSKPMHYSVRDDALLSPVARPTGAKNMIDHLRMAELEAKARRGERLTETERHEWWRIQGQQLVLDVAGDVRAKQTASGIGRVIAHFALVCAQQTLKREQLEDRVEELERRLAADGGRLRVVGASK